MALSAFADKSNEPASDELRRTLGRASARWDELLGHLAAEFEPLDSDWTFAGAKWGWSLRLRHEKRAILYLTPCRKHFLAGFALGERAVAAARRAALPDSTLAILEGARKYAEGRAVRLEIRTKADLEAVKRLAAIKMAN